MTPGNRYIYIVWCQILQNEEVLKDKEEYKLKPSSYFSEEGIFMWRNSKTRTIK